jgi:hypothetical protein
VKELKKCILYYKLAVGAIYQFPQSSTEATGILKEMGTSYGIYKTILTKDLRMR